MNETMSIDEKVMQLEKLEDKLRQQLLRCPVTRAIGRNSADVEDVLQETFLRLWKYRDRFNPLKGPLDSWAWCIARNLAVDELRRRSRSAAAVLSLSTVAKTQDTEPDGAQEAEEARHVLADAIGRVTNPQMRQVLELRLVAGLSYAAICRVTGVRHGTVATWIHRLRCSLRTEARRAA